jgi:hypothetical protein
MEDDHDDPPTYRLSDEQRPTFSALGKYVSQASASYRHLKPPQPPKDHARAIHEAYESHRAEIERSLADFEPVRPSRRGDYATGVAIGLTVAAILALIAYVSGLI